MTQKKWLVIAHVLFAVAWLGTAIVFAAMNMMIPGTHDGAFLSVSYQIMLKLDETLMIGSGLGELLTGILLCVLTQWGLFKYPWLIVKEVLTVFSLLLGWFGMNRWLAQVVTITAAEGLGALHDPAYLGATSRLAVGGPLELLSLTAAVVLSVLKPWGKRKGA